jgi:hypothetical protein
VLLTGGPNASGDTMPLNLDKLRALFAAIGDIAS